jgi:malate dehydrogenase (quinone)
MLNAMPPHFDVVVIGAGIMSATLVTLLKELQPQLKIAIIERLPEIGKESSDAWNNAGTGHSAFCELNYTPMDAIGHVDIKKACKIAQQFEISRELWAFLVARGSLQNPASFIRRVPHISVVWDHDCDFLRRRHAAMIADPHFADMLLSDDKAVLAQWMPLVMDGREPSQQVVATKMECGTDVNFGELTRMLFRRLERVRDVTFLMQHEIVDLVRHVGPRSPAFAGSLHEGPNWRLTARDLRDMNQDNKIDRTRSEFTAGFVFIGAGGGALPLLERANVVEAEGYGGFPISGQWLICNNPAVVAAHHAKVYGKAKVGSPPMSVPHLDTRVIDGDKRLLFGPFAGFSTKFLKSGSYFDLPRSIEWANMFPMLSAGWHNLDLTRYLVDQVAQTDEDRIAALREYLPLAQEQDWELATAGQRVQIIKRGRDVGGVLEFGTEVVATADHSLAALLGASPGASTSAAIVLEVLQKCFATHMQSEAWQQQLAAIVPSYVSPPATSEECLARRAHTATVLELLP